MSFLADKLSSVEVAPEPKKSKAPCHARYGDGDLEDYEAIRRLRDKGLEWIQVQRLVDELSDVEDPLPIRKFTRHWRQDCSCWSR